MHEGSKVERAAVVCDVRGGEYFDGAASRCSTTRRAAASTSASSSSTPTSRR